MPKPKSEQHKQADEGPSNFLHQEQPGATSDSSHSGNEEGTTGRTEANAGPVEIAPDRRLARKRS
jgi:hypothetical protein